MSSVRPGVVGASALLIFMFWPVALMVFFFGGDPQSCQAAVGPDAASAPNTATAAPSRPGQHRYSQTQLQSAVARYDPQQAVALGAIAMAETSGWDFPTTNPTGRYHGPWAFQEQSNPTLNFNQLDGNLDYAAKAAADLARTGITHGKWETWPTMAVKFMPGGSAFGQAQAVSAGPQPQQPACDAGAFSGSTVHGPGGGLTGNWAPGVYPIVRMIADRFHVTASTYPGHQPDEGHAADFAVGQFGNDWTDGSPGHPGRGPQWQIAQWIASNLVDKGLAWYVGHHASIHNRQQDGPGQWRPMGSQVGSSDPTYAHMNHIHVSWPPWFGNVGGTQVSSFTPAGNFSAPPMWAVPPMPAKLA